MAIDFKQFEKDMDDWVNSSEGQEYFNRVREKEIHLQKRFNRFEEWLKHNDFDDIFYRILLKHGSDYQEKCYHNGYEPMPNNVLSFVIEYITRKYDKIIVPELNCKFPNDIWFFKGYYIQMIYGQGVITKIYTKKDLREILSI
jgi:hypothetical protein